MDLTSLLSQTAEGHLQAIRDDGSMPPGRNGLYNDKETPVRNTAHWTCLFSWCYQETSDERFLEAVEQTSSYLTSNDARPDNETFHHRSVPDKDDCNGLIGQAWTIEALAEAATILEDPSIVKIATDVFLAHPQDERSGLWKRVEIDGQTLPFDATFNHQLWFAAAGALLAADPRADDRVGERVRRFLEELKITLRTYSSGLIFHPLLPRSLRRLAHLIRVDERSRIGVTFLTSIVPLPSRQRALKWKALGYHAFNLYALALLKQQYPDHDVWQDETCQQTLDYITRSAYRDEVWDNEYGSPYNPVGFEVPFAMQVFDIGTDEDRRWWVQKQLNRHYNPWTSKMDRNTPDKETLTARMYEATRLKQLELSKIKL